MYRLEFEKIISRGCDIAHKEETGEVRYSPEVEVDYRGDYDGFCLDLRTGEDIGRVNEIYLKVERDVKTGAAYLYVWFSQSFTNPPDYKFILNHHQEAQTQIEIWADLDWKGFVNVLAQDYENLEGKEKPSSVIIANQLLGLPLMQVRIDQGMLTMKFHRSLNVIESMNLINGLKPLVYDYNEETLSLVFSWKEV